MARQLIESLATEFDPAKYRDEYRERVLELIERKAEGEEIAVQAAPEEPHRGARPDGGARGQPRPPRRRSRQGEGAPRKQTARKNGAGQEAAPRTAPAEEARAAKKPTTKKREPRAKA